MRGMHKKSPRDPCRKSVVLLLGKSCFKTLWWGPTMGPTRAGAQFMGPSGVRGVFLFAMASHAVGRQFARLDIDVSTSQTVAGGALASFELCNSDVLEPILAAQSFCSDLTGVHDLECVDQVVRAMTHWASSTLMSRKSLTMRAEATLDDWLIMAAAILVNAAITAHSFVRTPTPRPVRSTLS